MHLSSSWKRGTHTQVLMTVVMPWWSLWHAAHAVLAIKYAQSMRLHYAFAACGQYPVSLLSLYSPEADLSSLSADVPNSPSHASRRCKGMDGGLSWKKKCQRQIRNACLATFLPSSWKRNSAKNIV
eukprot:6214484-Pleurochrysis_carterae.AAC.2